MCDKFHVILFCFIFSCSFRLGPIQKSFKFAAFAIGPRHISCIYIVFHANCCTIPDRIQQQQQNKLEMFCEWKMIEDYKVSTTMEFALKNSNQGERNVRNN